MFKPDLIAIDFETEENGYGSTEFYRPAFRISSAAFSWFDINGEIRSEFIEGEYFVRLRLTDIVDAGIPVIAHNAQYEIGCIACRFNALAPRFIWLADTMRLVQVYDNGGDPLAFETLESLDEQLDALLEAGDEEDERKIIYLAGLGLVKACRRILKAPDHKEEAYKWLRENVPGCKAGKEGRFLKFLPRDYLERYNVGDTEWCLRLYKHITDEFKQIGYDWCLDHKLYFSSVYRIVEAKIRGVLVDREALATYRAEVEAEIEGIGTAFRNRFLQPILAVERERLLCAIRKRKTLRGRKSYLRRIRQSPERCLSEIGFNVGSGAQLEALFTRQLHMSARFKTDKGQPSFRSAVLHQWGEGGEILKARRKRLLVFKQCDALLALSLLDRRWHQDLKACGTSTGRFAGGSHGG